MLINVNKCLVGCSCQKMVKIHQNSPLQLHLGIKLCELEKPELHVHLNIFVSNMQYYFFCDITLL